MAFSRRRRFKKREKERNKTPERSGPPGTHDLINPEHTGSEADYLKSLVDSHAKVTVVLKSGERLHGHIRYYDQHCFSLGLSSRGPRLFIRKENVSYISEE